MADPKNAAEAVATGRLTVAGNHTVEVVVLDANGGAAVLKPSKPGGP